MCTITAPWAKFMTFQLSMLPINQYSWKIHARIILSAPTSASYHLQQILLQDYISGAHVHMDINPHTTTRKIQTRVFALLTYIAIPPVAPLSSLTILITQSLITTSLITLIIWSLHLKTTSQSLQQISMRQLHSSESSFSKFETLQE